MPSDRRHLGADFVLEQQLSERLVLNVLPGSAAGRLRAHLVADSHPAVTVLVADLAGFPASVRALAPDAMEALVSAIYADFDRVVAAHGLWARWRPGDPYLAAAGYPTPCGDHADRAAEAALDLIASLAASARRAGIRLHARLGLCSGPVVVGNVGGRPFLYDLWGDTVHTAERLEREAAAGRVLVSESTRLLLSPRFRLERRLPERNRPLLPLPAWWLALNAQAAPPAR